MPSLLAATQQSSQQSAPLYPYPVTVNAQQTGNTAPQYPLPGPMQAAPDYFAHGQEQTQPSAPQFTPVATPLSPFKPPFTLKTVLHALGHMVEHFTSKGSFSLPRRSSKCSNYNLVAQALKEGLIRLKKEFADTSLPAAQLQNIIDEINAIKVNSSGKYAYYNKTQHELVYIVEGAIRQLNAILQLAEEEKQGLSSVAVLEIFLAIFEKIRFPIQDSLATKESLKVRIKSLETSIKNHKKTMRSEYNNSTAYINSKAAIPTDQAEIKREKAAFKRGQKSASRTLKDANYVMRAISDNFQSLGTTSDKHVKVILKDMAQRFGNKARESNLVQKEDNILFINQELEQLCSSMKRLIAQLKPAQQTSI